MHQTNKSMFRVIASVTFGLVFVAGCEEYRYGRQPAAEPQDEVVQKPAATKPVANAPAAATMPSVKAPEPAAKTPASESTAVVVEAAIPAYRAEQTVSGPLRSVGSDSMDRLMQLWEAQFKKTHPDVVLRHEGKGSGTALPALMKGLSDLGPMSRAVTAEETASFNQRFNHPPTQVRVALDGLAIVVHPSNPIAKTGLSFQQLDAIYSTTRKRGGTEDITSWGQLGGTGVWADSPIKVCSRNKASGTYAFLREHVLQKGEFKPTNLELPGSQEVIDAVAADPTAIGFCSVGYVTPAVVAVPLSVNAGQPVVTPDSANVYANRYPLARYFYLTVNYDNETPLTPQTQEFIRFVLSADGQASVLKEGLFPLKAADTTAELAKLNLKH